MDEECHRGGLLSGSGVGSRRLGLHPFELRNGVTSRVVRTGKLRRHFAGVNAELITAVNAGCGEEAVQNALSVLHANFPFADGKMLHEQQVEQFLPLVGGQRSEETPHPFTHGPASKRSLRPPSGRSPVWRSPRESGRTRPSRGGRCPWRSGSGGASP